MGGGASAKGICRRVVVRVIRSKRYVEHRFGGEQRLERHEGVVVSKKKGEPKGGSDPRIKRGRRMFFSREVFSLKWKKGRNKSSPKKGKGCASQQLPVDTWH